MSTPAEILSGRTPSVERESDCGATDVCGDVFEGELFCWGCQLEDGDHCALCVSHEEAPR